MDYRERLYAAYLSGRELPVAPATLDGLRPRLPYLRRMIRRHVPPNRSMRILDLGCGHGAVLHALRQAGYTNAAGIDASEEQVAAARRLGIDGVAQGDVIATLKDMTPESVDVVIAFDLVEHFRKEELVQLTDLVLRVLRTGGLWLIHTPNAEGPFGGRMRYWDFTHELAFTRSSLDQLLRSVGFSRVRCYEDRPVPHGPVSFGRAVCWAAIRAVLLFYIAAETGAFDRDAIFSQNLLAVAVR